MGESGQHLQHPPHPLPTQCDQDKAMGMSGTFPCLSLLLSLLNLEFDRRKAIKSTAPGGEGVGGVVPLPIGTAAAEPCNPTPALTCGGAEEPGGGEAGTGLGTGQSGTHRR